MADHFFSKADSYLALDLLKLRLLPGEENVFINYRKTAPVTIWQNHLMLLVAGLTEENQYFFHPALICRHVFSCSLGLLLIHDRNLRGGTSSHPWLSVKVNRSQGDRSVSVRV